MKVGGSIFYLVTSIVFFTFIGLIVGEAIGIAFNNLLNRNMHLLLSFCGGTLVGLLFFELIPESLQNYTFQSLILGLVFGLLLIKLIDETLHNRLHSKKYNSLQSFMIMVFAISIHNLPLGVAYGLSINSSINSTFLLVAILHHIPEGLALAITFLKGKYSKYILLIISFCIASTLGIGALIGIYNGGISDKMEGLITGVTIGSILFVACHELIWKTKTKGSMSGLITSMSLGFIIAYLYFELFLSI